MTHVLVVWKSLNNTYLKDIKFKRNYTNIMERKCLESIVGIIGEIEEVQKIDLFKKIITTFGEDAIIAYGDWSGSTKGIKGVGAATTTGLRRRIDERLMVVDTPEYNTSKTCCRCHEKVLEDTKRTII